MDRLDDASPAHRARAWNAAPYCSASTPGASRHHKRLLSTAVASRKLATERPRRHPQHRQRSFAPILLRPRSASSIETVIAGLAAALIDVRVPVARAAALGAASGLWLARDMVLSARPQGSAAIVAAPFASPPRSSALTGALRDHWARKIGFDHERHHCHGTRERLNSD
jgi:truncated hemoglobin YjbI